MNTTVLKKLEIYLPLVSSQKEFAQRVTEIREMESDQAASKTHLNTLFQSLLHCAFEEEL